MRAVRRLAVLAALTMATFATGADAHPGARAAERALSPAADGGLDADASLRRAAARRELGDLDGAADDLARAMASGRAAPERIALERARLAGARGEDDAARRRYDEAVRAARPDGATSPSVLLVEALTERAARRAGAGERAEARADWDAVFAARPTADAALARGALDEASGDLARAADGYRAALAIVDAVALRRALVTVELRRERWDAVIALANEALRAPAARVDWLLLRADAHAGAGRTAEAQADRQAALVEADRALAARPSDLRRLSRARALLALGRNAEARAEAQAVLRDHPTLEEARELVEATR
jgi:tetratricopeptide (TPR) repeat protein